MNIIYECENKRSGIVVVQVEPHSRTIWRRQTPKLYSFPYIIFIITYEKTVDGKFQYKGFGRASLAVYFAEKPITLKDKVEIAYTEEEERCGVVCTPHEHDGKLFNSLESLIFFVTSLWFQSTHVIGPNHERQKFLLDKILRCFADSISDKTHRLAKIFEAFGLKFVSKRKRITVKFNRVDKPLKTQLTLKLK